MLRRSCLFFALLAWVVASARLGQAQDAPRREVLVVRAQSGHEEEAHAVAERIVERSAAVGTDVVLAPDPAVPTGPRDVVAEATGHADEAFASLAFGEALRAIDAALEAADRDGVRSRSAIVEVLLLSSMLHGAVGDTASADEAARHALAIERTLEIDPARYPPTLSARIDALRPTIARCTARIRVDPSDAALVVDGERVLAPPSELGCGLHWITAARTGYTTTTRRLTLRGGAETEETIVALALDPAAALAASGAADTPIDPLAERGAAALGRQLVVLDLVHDETGRVRATLGARSVRVSPSSTPDEIAAALLAPIDRGLDPGVAVGVGVGVGVAVATAVAIALGFALTPSAPRGWTGVGEVVRP